MKKIFACSLKIQKLTVTGDKATAIVSQWGDEICVDNEGLYGAKGKDHRFQGTRTLQDSWAKVKGVWKVTDTKPLKMNMLVDGKPWEEVVDSQIDGNTPATADFDRIFTRDLTAYFTKSQGKGISVTYKYLREGATQSGVSYPKYYLWVSVYRFKKLIDTGAVRVAAVDQTHFEITDYVSKAGIQKNPKQIESIFPQPVCAKIMQFMK